MSVTRAQQGVLKQDAQYEIWGFHDGYIPECVEPYLHSPIYIFVAWCSAKHSDNFVFTFTIEKYRKRGYSTWTEQ
jgi:hypothetical protein